MYVAYIAPPFPLLLLLIKLECSIEAVILFCK